MNKPRTSDNRPRRGTKVEDLRVAFPGFGADATAKGFPPGARVLVDGRDEAVVCQHFPAGSSSYMFPHYKVRFLPSEPGDEQVAVHVSKVGVDRKEPK